MEDSKSSSSGILLAAGAESGAKKAGENIVDRALNALVDFLGDKYGKAQVRLTGSVYQKYLENAYKRYNQVRTLVTGTEPRPIVGPDNIYINIGVRYHDKEIDTFTVEPMLQISKNLLICGTGGVGKSMLMRYLFLNTVNRGEYVPVLLEVRRVSQQPSNAISIMDLIYACMKDFDVQLPLEQFEYSLQCGKYLFLFDGFDEVKEELALETAAAIQAFCAKYPKNPCIITSRPGRDFAPLETFTELGSMMLTKEQAVQLSGKFWSCSEKTREFSRQLEENLFEVHQDFAENPLLLSMMFLTFMYNNSIPDHLVDFYDKAYLALYSAHDNRDKGVYRRDFQCKTLEERTFKLLLSHFCFHSYFEEAYEFSEDRILELLDKSIQKLGLSGISSLDYLADLRNVVCLIVRDGDLYRFAHRSFQCYFAAVYTATVLSDEQQKKLLNSYFKNETYWEKEDFYKLLYQLGPERFGINALESGLRTIQKKLSESDDPAVLLMRMRSCGIKISARESRGVRIYYHIGGRNEYWFNITAIFQKCFEPLQHAERLNEGNLQFVISCVQKILERDNIEDHEVTFEKVDASNQISDEERQKLYSSLAEERMMPQMYHAINDWLHRLDTKRAALRRSDFLDSL